MRTHLARALPSWIGAATILGSAACGGGATPTDPDPAPSSSLLAALAISAEPSTPRVGRGGVVDVTVRVVNRADTAITVAGSGSCGIRLEVRDGSGRLAGQSRNQVCTADCRGYVFAPGQAVVRSERFLARYWDAEAQREVTLASGVYQLAGRVDGDLGRCGGTPAQAAGPAADVRVD